jgi:hypothetical protein
MCKLSPRMKWNVQLRSPFVRLAVTLFNQIKLKRALNSVNYEDKSSDLHDVDMKIANNKLLSLANHSCRRRQQREDHLTLKLNSLCMKWIVSWFCRGWVDGEKLMTGGRKRERSFNIDTDASGKVQGLRRVQFVLWFSTSWVFTFDSLKSSPSILLSLHSRFLCIFTINFLLLHPPILYRFHRTSH